MIKKILIFGITGMLGRYIYSYFKNNTEIEIIHIEYHVSLENFENLEEILLLNNINKETCIINCIGQIPQRKNNKNNNVYYIVNSLFPHLLWSIVKKYNAKMIQPTTDCVFSGNKNGGQYLETDQHDEDGHYGMSKSLGEPLGCTVIRTSIIGRELINKKSLMEWIIDSYAKGNIINGYTNHYWNGITCLEYCKVIEKIISNNLFWSGIRHIFSPNTLTKYEMAVTIVETFFNVDKSKINTNIIPTKTIETINKTLSSIYPNDFEIQDLERQINELKYNELNIISSNEYFIK